MSSDHGNSCVDSVANDIINSNMDNGEDRGGRRSTYFRGNKEQDATNLLRGSIVNFRIPSTYDVKCFTGQEYGEKSWRYRLLSFLHSRCVQRVLFTLLLLDVIILFTELALLTVFPSCQIIVRDAISCCPASNQTSTTVLAGSKDQICEDDNLEESPMFPAGCDSHKWHSVHTVETVLFSFTITILTIMMIDLILSVIALKPQVFFRQFFYTLDFFIVATSLVMESIFRSIGNDYAQSFIGFLVILRLWRFVRIAHGIIELTAEISHDQYEELLTYTEELEQLCQRYQIQIPDTRTIRQLKHETGPKLIAKIEKEHRHHHFKHFTKHRFKYLTKQEPLSPPVTKCEKAEDDECHTTNVDLDDKA